MWRPQADSRNPFSTDLKKRGVLLSAGNYMGLRAVTHLDVTKAQVEEAATAIQETMRAR